MRILVEAFTERKSRRDGLRSAASGIEFGIETVIGCLHHVDIVEMAGDRQLHHHIGDRRIDPQRL